MTRFDTYFQAAITERKPKKDDIFDALRTAVTDAGEGQIILTPKLAVGRLGYFTPPKPKNAKTDLDWVQSAVGHDTRYYLHNVWYNAHTCHIVATDGHRLHIAPYAGPSKSGHLTQLGTPMETDGVFPGYGELFDRRYVADALSGSNNGMYAGNARSMMPGMFLSPDFPTRQAIIMPIKMK